MGMEPLFVYIPYILILTSYFLINLKSDEWDGLYLIILSDSEPVMPEWVHEPYRIYLVNKKSRRAFLIVDCASTLILNEPWFAHLVRRVRSGSVFQVLSYDHFEDRTSQFSYVSKRLSGSALWGMASARLDSDLTQWIHADVLINPLQINLNHLTFASSEIIMC